MLHLLQRFCKPLSWQTLFSWYLAAPSFFVFSVCFVLNRLRQIASRPHAIHPPFQRTCIVIERTHFVLWLPARWEHESRDEIFKLLLYKVRHERLNIRGTGENSQNFAALQLCCLFFVKM